MLKNNIMKRVILIAYDLNPTIGSECGIANLWLKIISKYYFVDVFVDAVHKKDILEDAYQNVNFHFIEGNRLIRKWVGRLGAYNILNGVFIVKTKNEIEKLNIRDFCLLHCITPLGVHSYNDLYKLGLPVLIGPLGGGLKIPKGFEGTYSVYSLKDLARYIFYTQVKRNKHWREYFLKAKKIIIGTDYLNDILPEQVRDKCVVIFDTLVDTSYFVPNHERICGTIKKVLFSGRLHSSKGINLLIESVRLCVQESCTDFIVEIAGEGPLETQIKELIDKYSLAKYINFLGKLSKQEMLRAYQDCDIFCLPTLREPGGTAILEAMSCGLPIITSNYGGPKYSVADDCGIKIDLISPQDYIQKLAKALAFLIKNDDLRKKMGEKARKRAEDEFSVAAMEPKIRNVYKELIGNDDV
jgi:glycosyltransferase involved in cell wall biosynthesis